MISIKAEIKRKLPDWSLYLYKELRRSNVKKNVMKFLFDNKSSITFPKRLFIIKKIFTISYRIECPHTQSEMISFIKTILALPNEVQGSIVEAGCFKGGSTAKFSIAAKLANRKLIVFDSFQGIPKNNEQHDKNIFGGDASFQEGDYCGDLEEVKNNIEKYGSIENCVFIKGFFDATMPNFSEPIAAIYLDVDLASSTRTCLQYLYPLLNPGGMLFSQDGHLPLVINVFDDDEFWEMIGYDKPFISGLGTRKLIYLTKPE